MKVDIAGVKVDNVTKEEAIAQIDSYVQSGSSHYVVTPYSEMIVFALNDKEYKAALNSADLSLPDGAGIVWAANRLGIKLKGRVTGRKFIFDLAKLCVAKNYSLALVGGIDNVAAQAAYELKKLYPRLNIKLALSGRPFNDEIITEINDSNSDILLIAYSPPKQELWLLRNYKKLNTKAAIGLGGTFDYIAGKRLTPPNFMHSMGLEWLWRLITQPWRFKRIWNAVPVFVFKILKYKLNGQRSSS